MNPWLWTVVGVGGVWLVCRGVARVRLSLAKHPSLRGHGRIALWLSKLLPHYEYAETEAYSVDGAPPEIAERRRAAMSRLQELGRSKAPRTTALSMELESGISDVDFTNAYRVPFQFRELVRRRLRVGVVAERTLGVQIGDLDGNWYYDLGGAYGTNLFGYDFYKQCIDRAVDRARELGPVLGSYHPLVIDNVARLQAISGMDEVSFHMSGTEAVMQAVRLARYHTGRSHIVRFCGAYHGWWDGVQPGPGNPRPPHEVYTLKEMDPATLTVLRTRSDIACVLVNAIQALHPNAAAPSDGMLVASDRKAHFDKPAYAAWLCELRKVCDDRGIALVIDDVFLGFRLAPGGTQEYFGVRADLVTYGKTLGGGLPVGVVCGRRAWMRRYRDDRPSDVCFARGTFNAHPYVMAAMNEFLHALATPALEASYVDLDARWDARANALNARLTALDLPVRVANMTSVFTTVYTRPGRYNWMFQYYLRAQGLAMSWIGTGRFIFSHNYGDADFAAVCDRFAAAAAGMKADGWLWQSAELTDRAIKRRVLRELLGAALRRTSGRSAPRAAGAAVRANTA